MQGRSFGLASSAVIYCNLQLDTSVTLNDAPRVPGHPPFDSEGLLELRGRSTSTKQRHH
jgi:hypothetical protein